MDTIDNIDNIEEADNSFFAALDGLGVNANIGMGYCGDIAFYKEILKISVEAYMEKSANLIRYFEGEDYKSYTILVHSIKSGAKNIGAIELSDMAGALEQAGKNGDYNYIRSNHDAFMLSYKKTMEGVAGIISFSYKVQALPEDAGLEELSASRWEALLEEMNYYLRELEIDMALELVDRMLCFKLPHYKAKHILSDIRNRLQHFDVEGAKADLNILAEGKSVL